MSSQLTKALLLVTIICLAALPALAQGGTCRAFLPLVKKAGIEGNVYYVAPGGDDANPGTITEPWRTPVKAGDTAQAGDTVYFRGGTYYNAEYIDGRNAFLYPVNSGTPDAWITFTNYPGEEPVIVQDTYYSRAVRLFEVSYIEVSGLTLEGAGANGHGLEVMNAHHVRVVGNVARNSGTCGITANNGADHVLVAGNVLHGNSNRGYWNGSAISFNNSGCLRNPGNGYPCTYLNDGAPGYHNVIQGNLIYDNRNISELTGRDETDGNGIIMDNAGPDNPPTLIANNVIFHNGGRCVHVFNTGHVSIYNNTCYKNQETPRLSSQGEISVAQTSAYQTLDIDVRNNAVYSNDGGAAVAIYGSPTPDEYELDHNLWFNGVIRILGGVGIGPHAVTERDPLFVNPSLDPETADFHLQPGSPAVDGGATLAAVTNDFDGVARPQGVAYDMGAYEHPGAQSSSEGD